MADLGSKNSVVQQPYALDRCRWQQTEKSLSSFASSRPVLKSPPQIRPDCTFQHVFDSL